MSIPPNTGDYTVKGERIRFEKKVMIYSLLPHMHYRGRSMKATAFYPNGTSEVLLSIPNYSFNWQRVYQLEEPKIFPAGTVLEPEAVYDNSKKNPFNPDPNATVHYGLQSQDEMLVLDATYVEVED